jgi:hypothetical protein
MSSGENFVRRHLQYIFRSNSLALRVVLHPPPSPRFLHTTQLHSAAL